MDPATPALRRRIRAFAIVWTAACAILALLVVLQLLSMRDGADAMDEVGVGLTTTARSLDELADLPLVGGAVADAADTVEASGGAVRDSAAEVDRSLLLLALFAGCAITLLPSVPVLLLWWIVESSSAGRE